jgi:hypothetical protein
MAQSRNLWRMLKMRVSSWRSPDKDSMPVAFVFSESTDVTRHAGQRCEILGEGIELQVFHFEVEQGAGQMPSADDRTPPEDRRARPSEAVELAIEKYDRKIAILPSGTWPGVSPQKWLLGLVHLNQTRIVAGSLQAA